MRRALSFLLWLMAAVGGADAFADVVTLKSGQQLVGSVESGTSAEIQIRIANSMQTVALDQIQSIRFDPGEALTTTVTTTPGPLIAGQTVQPPAAPAMTLPAQMEIAIRTIDPIDTKTADLSREYSASLADPLIVNNVIVAPARANAVLRVTNIKKLKKLQVTGHASLSLRLVAITINGERVNVESEDLVSDSGSQGSKTAKAAGIGAGAGALGCIAGAIGCAVGIGTGTLVGGGIARINGERVTIAPETRLRFKLKEAVPINLKQETLR